MNLKLPRTGDNRPARLIWPAFPIASRVGWTTETRFHGRILIDVIRAKCHAGAEFTNHNNWLL
jgi:hypothetical protein